MAAKVTLNIINPEAIEAFIRGMVNYLPEDKAPEFQEWAIAALTPAICSSPSLFKAVTELPEGGPAWLSAEKLAHGTFHRFAPREDETSFRDCARIYWLATWLNVAFMGHVHIRGRALPASWFRGLRHIRNLEDAIGQARRDLAAWAPDRQEGVSARWHDARWLVTSGAMVARSHRPDRGLIWYELMKPEALRAEAALMVHCLHGSTYRAELQSGRARFFSLRTPDGTPQLTVRVPMNGRWEAYRRRNTSPRAEDKAAAQALLDEIATEPRPLAKGLVIAPDDADQWDRQRSFESLVWELQSRDQELSRREPKSEEEIHQLVAAWLAGPGDDLEELMVQVMEALGASQLDDADGAADRDPDIDSKAYHLVEAAIDELEPTLLNFRRVRAWCWSYTSDAGHRALLTTFREMLSDQEFEGFRREALSCWGADIVREWCWEESDDP